MRTAILTAAMIHSLAAPGWAARAHDGKHYDEFAIGYPADPDEVNRTIVIQITDQNGMSVTLAPTAISIEQDASVLLAIRNAGSVPHEFVMAAPDAIADHRVAMAGDTDMDHRAPYAKRLTPGETGEIYWTFPNTGVFAFACLIPGHVETGTISVLAVEEPKAQTIRKEMQ